MYVSPETLSDKRIGKLLFSCFVSATFTNRTITDFLFSKSLNKIHSIIFIEIPLQAK